MAVVAELLTKLTADTSEFNSKISSAQSKMGAFAEAGRAAGTILAASFAAATIAVGLLIHSLSSSAEKIDAIYVASKKVGSSVEGLQLLAAVGEEAGVSFGGLETALYRMNAAIGKSAVASENSNAALNALNLSAKDFIGLDAAEKFELVARKISNVGDVTIQSAIAQKLFGKGAKEVLTLFNGDLDESIAKMKELGFAVDDSQASAIHQLEVTRKELGLVWGGFKDQVTAALAPVATALLKSLQESITKWGGLKEVAKSTANYIIDAMEAVSKAIDKTSSVINKFSGFKQQLDNPQASFGYIGLNQAGLGLAKIASGIKNALAPDSNISQANNTQPNNVPQSSFVRMLESLRPDSKVDSLAPATEVASNKLKDFSVNTQHAIDAMSELKQVTDDLKAAGKKQAADLINKAANPNLQATSTTSVSPISSYQQRSIDLQLEQASLFGANTDALKILSDKLVAEQTARNTTTLTSQSAYQKLEVPAELMQQFQNILTDLVQDPKHNADDNLAKLTGIISALQKETTEVNRTDGSSFNMPTYDTSGLIQAVKEIRSYLAKDSPGLQKVDVNIKIDPNPLFTTTIVQSQEFLQGVDSRVTDVMEQTARGQ